nr:hypothetical protein [Halobacillus locisalis]
MFFLLFGGVLLLLNVITSVWAYRDAKHKGKSALYCLVVLIGTLFFPVGGLIIYAIIRND